MGRLLTGENVAPVVRNMFQIRSQCFFDPNIVSLGVLPSICEALHKYELFNYFESNSVFPSYAQWKAIVRSKIKVLKKMRGVLLFSSTPSCVFAFAKSCLELVPPKKVWSISSYYSDLVCRLHVQTRLVGNFGLNTSIPWATTSDSSIASSAKKVKRLYIIFFSVVRVFGSIFDHIWSSLTTKVKHSNPTDGSHMSDFLVNLEQHQKALLLTGCLPFLFDSATIMTITRFVAQRLVKFTDCALKNCASWRLHRLPNNLAKLTASFLFNLSF